jgi:uncharacterized protein (TIGR00369 family)
MEAGAVSEPVLRERRVRWQDPALAVQYAVDHRLSGLDFLRAMREGRVPPPPVAVLLGFELESADAGHVVFGLDPQEFHDNPNGVLHGGVAAALLDTVVGCAVISRLPFGVTCATLELKVNYLRSIADGDGHLTATGTVLHLGRRSALAEAKLLTDEGKLAAHATATLMIFPPDEIHRGRRRPR